RWAEPKVPPTSLASTRTRSTGSLTDSPAVNALDVAMLSPALIAGLLVLSTHVPLGAIALRRGSIFTGLALAQIAALGGTVGSMIWGTAGEWAGHAGAISVTVASALVLASTDRDSNSRQEAIAGVFYIVAAAIQIGILF